MSLRVPKRRWRALLALAIVSVGAEGSAEASPQDVFGFGVRSAGMGATGAAVGQGYETVYGNPALLALTHERQLTLGTMGAAFDLSAGEEVPYEALRGNLIGVVLPIPFEDVLEDRVTAGLGFFSPYDLIVRARLRFPETPQFPLADRTQSVAVQAGLGLDLGYGFRLGGGFTALAALEGSVVVATDTSGRLGTVIEDTLVASYAPIVGASYDITDHYRLGITYHGELSGPLDVVIEIKDLGQLVIPPLHISGIAQYDPHQVAVELARIGGPIQLALGATWKHWSAYPGVVEATVRCSYDEETLEPFPCTAPGAADPDYSDTVVPRIGIEGEIAPAEAVRVQIRGGYLFEPSPAPEQTGEANVFEEARSAFSVGYSVALLDPLPPIRLDVFGQLHVLHGRTHVKDAAVTPDNLGSPELTTSGLILAGGTQLEVAF